MDWDTPLCQSRPAFVAGIVPMEVTVQAPLAIGYPGIRKYSEPRLPEVLLPLTNFIAKDKSLGAQEGSLF